MTREDQYLDVVRTAIGKPVEMLSALDLCCGELTMTCHLKFRESLHVDVIDYPNRPSGFVFSQCDAFHALTATPDKEFDVCLCLDGVEHFTRDDAMRLLSEMERVSKAQVIFTPIGAMWMDPLSTSPEAHKSAWFPYEFSKMGWNTMVFPDWHKEWGFGAFFAWKGKT